MSEDKRKVHASHGSLGQRVVGNGTADTGGETEETRGSTLDISSAIFGDDLVLSYPTTEEPVVDCRRIDIPAGEITALVGPNGSGKTTLLKALASHLPPDHGEVVLNGRDLQGYGTKELAQELGHLSQENISPESIQVQELVSHGRYPHRGFLESLTATDIEAVDRALDLAGIEHLRDQEVGQLSGGQKQLVWIAMVLAQDPEVLLLDEPTTFLDLNHQLRVMETIRRLNQTDDVTVAVVLHDISQAVRYADYLIALKEGGVYDWGPPSDVITEDLLAEVFGIEAMIDRDPHGNPQIFPEQPLDHDPS